MRLTIESLAAGGDGVARLDDGRVVFVPHVAVGDVAEVDVDTSARTLRGRLMSLVDPAPDRVEPVCPIAAVCGGCDWMHMSSEAQARAHRAIVAGLLARVRGVSWPEVIAHPATEAIGYRRRARLAVQAERGGVTVGYRATRSNRLVDVTSCAVLASPLAGVPDALRELMSGARGEGEARLAVGDGERPVVELTWKGDLPPTTWTKLDALVASAWAGARVQLAGASAPASFGDPRAVGVAADGEPLVSAPGGFSQPSDEGAARLARRVAELADVRGRHVVELFAGSGTLSVLLARQAASFVGVERDEAAVVAARDNLAARGLNAKVTVADADAFRIPPRAEVVVLDPPRSGAPGAVRQIAAARPKRVVYVSCDPATLARDLEELVRGRYRPTAAETFELFPQTSHVETVVAMER